MTEGERLLKRLRTAGLLVLPLLVFPYLTGLLLHGGNAAFAAVLGSFIAFLMSVACGWRTGALAMPVAVIVGGAAAIVHGGWAWVALLGLIGLVAGGVGRLGLSAPASMTGVLASVSPPQRWSDIWVFVLSLGLGAANAVLLARRLGLPAERSGQRLTGRRALAVSVVLGGLGALAGAIAVRWDVSHSYWLPMTVFLIAVPTAGVLVHQKALARLLGTLAGVAASALLLPLELPRFVDVLLGVLCLLFSLIYLRPLWLNTGLSAAATVLVLTGAGADQVSTSLIRLQAVALATMLMLAGLAAVALIARLLPPTREERDLARAYDPGGLHS